ncbi:hypothetical protein Pcinc_006900 [Petrolisthes cinctipes]|uniref:Integrase catalytic domain-containing protein n=1 Tax=Petrolisthes cinctipes TaxID=88211 RepID=A0AAE1GC55_PETCI|nr:hypothetical protein Pcinc_006900 [Petrolisthes cinctipes]
MPLVHALTRQKDALSPRQRRHLSAIAKFNCTLTHLPGKKNPVADTLSRIEINAVQLGLDYNQLAKEQQQDPETTAKFIWHKISRDAGNWVRSCVPCQKSKVHRHTETGPGAFHQPQRRFAHIHVDVVGPIPPSDGHRYLFTIIDRSTRRPEAIPMANATSTSCASSLLSGWISRFGIPKHITSDRGTTFISHLWTSLGQLMGTTVHHTTAYNPEANGIVERLYRTLKAALMLRCNNSTWSSQLPWVLLGLRSTPKEGLDASPAEMVFGEPLVVPGEFFPDAPSNNDISRLRNIVGKLAPCKQTYKPPDHCYIPRDLHSTKHVFLRTDAQTSPLTPPYSGPYEVIERRKKVFLRRIKCSNDWVSIDRLKPAYLQDDDPPPVRLSRAGRPLSHTSGHSR